MTAERLSLIAVICVVAGCGTGNIDGSANSDDAPALPPTTQGLTADPLVPGSLRDFQLSANDRVFFSVDRHDLTAAARATLDRQAEWLRRYPSRQIVVQGHADERGTREYNLALGERRANAIKSYLAALGVSPSRITTVSFGKEQPVMLGSNEAAWAQNRRGVIVLN